MAGQTIVRTALEFHPVANIFPLMEGQQFIDLVTDIRANGLRIPIVLHPDGSILDGRNRYRACVEAGVDVACETWDGKGSAVTYVVSLNLQRRHLDESQRAMVAAKIANLEHGGDRRPKQAANLPLETQVTQAEAASLVNVGERSVRDARKVIQNAEPELVSAVEQGRVAVSLAANLVNETPEVQRTVVARVDAGEKAAAVAKQIVSEQKRAERIKRSETISQGNSPLKPPSLFPIFYADPPWRYEHVKTDNRAIENKYPTLSLEEICALPVSEAVTPDAVLYLWATSPKLAEALAVVAAWGFTYRTCMVWVKDKIGMGYWARQQHEILLIATHGNPPTPDEHDRPASVIHAPRGDHSAKPVIFYELIERMFPTLPKAELFARSIRPGWWSWGNQAQ
jgi:N6-adenosine-specific RNA methylase IME4/ParB-like chromosome segregation protein Spo0J